MRLFVRLFLLSLLMAPFALAALLWFSLSEQPAVGGTLLSHQDIARAQAILKRNDPRGLAPGSRRRIDLGERDLNLALDYLAQKHAGGNARVTLRENRLRLAASMKLPLIPARPYLNIVATAETRDGVTRLSGFGIGAVPVPTFVADRLLRLAAERLYGTREYALASSVIQGLELQPGRLALTVRWHPDTLRILGARLAGADDDRLAVYHAQLLPLAPAAGRNGSIHAVLQPMFGLAHRRSAEEDPQADPIAENRALLLVLGAWASEHGTRALVPQARREPLPFALSLRRRQDLARHFLVSAAIAAGGDVTLSDAVGVFKEMADSRGGSGFSFADLAADRAGTRFGQLATASRDDARRVQRLLRDGFAEADIMPDVAGLPEAMSETEFKRRFGDGDGPRYRQLLEQIERRITACRLHRAGAPDAR